MNEPKTDEQPIPWVEDSEDGEVTVGEFHGPEPKPIRRVQFRDPNGNLCEQVVSEDAWKRLEQLRQDGYQFIATSSRRATRARKAQQKREARRAARHGRRSAS